MTWSLNLNALSLPFFFDHETNIRERFLLLLFLLLLFLVLNCSSPLSTLPSIMSINLYSPDLWFWSWLSHFWPCPFPEALCLALTLWPRPCTYKSWCLSFLQPGCFSLFKAGTSISVQFLHLSLLPSQIGFEGCPLTELNQHLMYNLDIKITFWKHSLW